MKSTLAALPNLAGSPVVLDASSVLAAAGANAIPDHTRLTPPGGRPMLINSISFNTVYGPLNGTPPLTFAQYILARLQVGRHALTNGFVPVTNFAPYYNSFYDTNGYLGPTVLIPNVPGAHGANTNWKTGYNHFRWILPEPLYVGPGEAIQIALQRTAAFGTDANPITVNIGIHGALLTKGMTGKRKVPYVSCFVPQPGQYIAGEQDLKNLLDKPLTVQRFVGFVWSNYPTARIGLSQLLGYSTAGNYPPNGIRLAMRDSANRYITFGGGNDNYVDWYSLFPEQNNAWTFRAQLAPNERYTLQYATGSIYTGDSTPYGNGASDAFNPVPQVSMVGYREESI